MSARVISFAEAFENKSKRSMRRMNQQPTIEPQPDLMQRFLFWRGASGVRYVHTIYTLLDCPALSSGNYILVRREKDGGRTVLAINRLATASPSLNLAEVRHQGALLGANEVHVHLLAESGRDSQQIEFDLRSGHFDTSAIAKPTRH
ncbi:MAG: hypothetical protein JNM89_01455 [Hyphomicrobiaceae bacterium]|jgi:hypothetical protein|nr:hypothetical protein [Hyphomicrobiaceae bacterium]